MDLKVAVLPVVGVHAEPVDASPLVTQILLGDGVVTLAEKSGWYRAIVPDGSCGWVREDAVGKVRPARGARVIVTRPRVRLEAEIGGVNVYMGTTLFVLEEKGDRYFVTSLAGTRGSLPKKAVAPVDLLSRQVTGAHIVATACLFLGTPYLWGGMTAEGIDCSGLSYICYRVHGYHLARDAEDQYRAGFPVGLAELAPGDLVFFCTTSPGASHVGIYIANGRFVNARTREGVCVSSLGDPYFRERFVGARRYI